MIGTIYKLTSPSGKSYIGQTTNLKDGKRCFYNPNKYYSGHKLDNAVKKYGIENFKYEIVIQIVESDKFKLRKKLDELEIYYIEKYDSYNNGYNMTLGGSGSKGCFQTEESRKKISDIFINEKIKPSDRNTWPVVLDSEDNIVWLPGIKKSKFDKKNTEEYDIILRYY